MSLSNSGSGNEDKERNSDEELDYDGSCYACGISLPDTNVIVSKESLRQFCSEECYLSGKKYTPPIIDKEAAPLTVPVKGKCNGKVIQGIATFSMHGEVFLEFTEPKLEGNFIVPKLFLQIVSELYTGIDHETF